MLIMTREFLMWLMATRTVLLEQRAMETLKTLKIRHLLLHLKDTEFALVKGKHANRMSTPQCKFLELFI